MDPKKAANSALATAGLVAFVWTPLFILLSEWAR